MNRIALFLSALLVAVALSTGGASAHGWHHHHHHHGLFGGWFHGGWHHGFRLHSAGGPARLGPHCWVTTDDPRGYGYFKWCDDARPVYRKHRHHHHH